MSFDEAALPVLQKVPTGIKGFDEITVGGLPAGRPTLVAGSAGSGKTLFGLEFLVSGATQYNENGVFMCFEETEDDLAINVSSLGFNLRQLVKDGKLAIDFVSIQRSEIEETGDTDLRPQKKSMEALRESREWFQVLADSMPHIVWTTDARGHATYFNRRWYEFTSRTQTMKPDDTDDIASILHPRDLPHYQALWAHVVDDPQAFHMECRIREAATQSYRWHLIRGLPVTNKGGMSLQWICTCTDIHEQKCAEQELARSNDELAQFAFVASHDLQEPLRKVMNYVGVFAAKYQDLVDESGHKYLTQILEGSRRMRDLIQGLLTLSRVGHENLEAETLMMSRVMDDVLSDQAGQISEAEARIELQPLPLLKIPRSELYQIFSNIVGNALKFKRSDVPLLVLVRAAHLAHDDLELIIQDNGIGIESEYLEQVFVPFKRLHTQNKYPGAGLGLAICRKIIERHGGRIWMESILGRGTSVHVVFPSQLVVWNQERP